MPLAGWVALLRAHDTPDAERSRRWAGEAAEHARRTGDADLELCALSQHGAALVQLGRVDEGIDLLDEAMAGSLAGEGRRLETVVYACCNMIGACSELAVLQRAAQWIRAADGFTQRFGSPHLYTTCRAHCGGILFATGDWAGAERELRAALAAGRSAERARLRRGAVAAGRAPARTGPARRRPSACSRASVTTAGPPRRARACGWPAAILKPLPGMPRRASGGDRAIRTARTSPVPRSTWKPRRCWSG